jgi:hypothetical protein
MSEIFLDIKLSLSAMVRIQSSFKNQAKLSPIPTGWSQTFSLHRHPFVIRQSPISIFDFRMVIASQGPRPAIGWSQI